MCVRRAPLKRSNHVFFISRLRPMVVVSIAGIKDRKERGCKSDNVLTTECFYFPLVWPSMVLFDVRHQSGTARAALQVAGEHSLTTPLHLPSKGGVIYPALGQGKPAVPQILEGGRVDGRDWRRLQNTSRPPSYAPRTG